jgi:serine/threonine-protein kinase
MGSIWAATDGDNDLPVALKFQTSQASADAHALSFAREVTALCSLSHPHVVGILGSGRDSGLSYIVMELLEGTTLRERLSAAPRLELRVAKDVITQTASALSAAHAAGVVHRDIKPSNLFLTNTSHGVHIKVLDFGIARSVALDATGSGSLLLGSPPYMSPEQARHLPLDGRTDLWSLAVVAFEILAGVGPFSDEDLPATLQRICRGEARELVGLRPDLPPALRGFFRRAFTVDRALRFQTATELAQHFARACEGHSEPSRARFDATQPITAQAAASGWRKRPQTAAALTAVVLVVLTASKAWTDAQGQPPALAAAPPAPQSTVAGSHDLAATVVPPAAPLLTVTAPAATLVVKSRAQRPLTRDTPVATSGVARALPSATAPGASPASTQTRSAPPAAAPSKPRNPLDRRF